MDGDGNIHGGHPMKKLLSFLTLAAFMVPAMASAQTKPAPANPETAPAPAKPAAKAEKKEKKVKKAKKEKKEKTVEQAPAPAK
jgi:Skp family chaperone for outer membrane proteins